MIQDRLSMFSEKQVVTVDADSTNILDLHAHGDDIQRNLMLFVQVREAVTSDGAATVTVKVNTNAALNAGGTALAAKTTIWTSAAVAKADLVDGLFLVKIPLPTGVKRYLQVEYDVSATLTKGKFDAGLAWGVDLP